MIAEPPRARTGRPRTQLPSDECGPCVAGRPGRDGVGVTAFRSSRVNVTGAFVTVLDRYMSMPIPPAVWSAAVVSVIDRCHDYGSAPPDFHTFARSAVGSVPTACIRPAR